VPPVWLQTRASELLTAIFSRRLPERASYSPVVFSVTTRCPSRPWYSREPVKSAAPRMSGLDPKQSLAVSARRCDLSKLRVSSPLSRRYVSWPQHANAISHHSPSDFRTRAKASSHAVASPARSALRARAMACPTLAAYLAVMSPNLTSASAIDFGVG